MLCHGACRLMVVVDAQVTALAAGQHTVEFTLPTGEPAGTCTFVASVTTATNDCGFIGVDQSVSSQHFVTSGGQSWFGVGMNLAWVNHATSINVSVVANVQCNSDFHTTVFILHGSLMIHTVFT